VISDLSGGLFIVKETGT